MTEIESEAAKTLRLVRDAEALRDHFLMGYEASHIRANTVEYTLQTWRMSPCEDARRAVMRLSINGRDLGTVIIELTDDEMRAHRTTLPQHILRKIADGVAVHAIQTLIGTI